MFNSSLIEAALHVSVTAHAAQHRKNSAKALYVTHPIAVAIICAQCGVTDECALAAAIMHDVIEDTAYSAHEITKMMSEQFSCSERSIKLVTQMILDLSEIKKDDAGNKLTWLARKTEHLKRLQSCSDEVLIVKAADTYHNISTLIDESNRSGFAIATGVFNTNIASLKWYWKETLALLLSRDKTSTLLQIEARLQRAICEIERLEKETHDKNNSLSRS